ncbi:hypothetical protein AAFF_G00322480 [Aldrovandia affinis]|uniref:Cadherin cytoplasmic C-terminal domain-containing protein n=1 Tax=Aldrovandia affinis TaxID=143900 RepID=A0AAD7SM83_9TELE|nr:hypothetical protein AAFF_G00322480 [Aldrovandia affinis]
MQRLQTEKNILDEPDSPQQIVLDNPIEFHRITIEIFDINDNAPIFPNNEIRLEISELAVPGARFVLDSAVDSDVGANTLQSYTLKPTDNFVLKVQPQPDGNVGGTGTLQHVYNYEVCRTTDSRKSDMKYVRPCSQSVISLDASGTQTLPHVQDKGANEVSEIEVRLPD